MTDFFEGMGSDGDAKPADPWDVSSSPDANSGLGLGA